MDNSTFSNATSNATFNATFTNATSNATFNATVTNVTSNTSFIDYGSIIPTEGEPKAEWPWIVVTVIAATMACTLAMAADAFRGFRFNKLWLPSKYFCLNAISLTLLGLAVKPIADINKGFTFTAGFFAKLNSLIFMSVALGNFSSSLGLMTDDEILANVVALGVIVVKTISSALIQLIDLWPHIFIGYIIILLFETVFVLLLLATLVSSALTVSTIKGRMEAKYQDRHKDAMGEEESTGKTEAYNIQDQIEHMMKYFVMAETSCPQFVMARSVVSTTSALISLLATIMLPLSFFRLLDQQQRRESPFKYEGFIIWITIIQLVGVIVGMFAPTLRWYVAVSFRRATWNRDSFKKGFKIEDHWIQTLLDWKNNSSLPVRPNKSTRYAHGTRRFALAFCIVLQKSIVLFSKFLVFISGLTVSLFRFKACKNKDHHPDLDGYVLLLKGEEALPPGILDNICRQADILIQKGRKEQPKGLHKLLKDKFVDFKGVGQFDSNNVENLQSQEPPNCWTLPVVTLTSIAIALPNVAKDKVKELVRPVSEGFSLAKFVDETMDEDATLANFRKAANVSWVGVVLHNKLHSINLKKTSFECKNTEQVLRKLASNAKDIVDEFEEKKDPVEENPKIWPAKVVAANSMYRVCQTMLSLGNELSSDELFDKLSVMIVGVLAACLTNLPRSINTICHINKIEKRGKSVRKAFQLLGKTEKVVEFLQREVRQPPDDLKAASIEEWRAFFQQNNGDAA